jgi:hypothetical protein
MSMPGILPANLTAYPPRLWIPLRRTSPPRARPAEDSSFLPVTAMDGIARTDPGTNGIPAGRSQRPRAERGTGLAGRLGLTLGRQEETVEYQGHPRVHPGGCRPGGRSAADIGAPDRNRVMSQQRFLSEQEFLRRRN